MTPFLFRQIPSDRLRSEYLFQRELGKTSNLIAGQFFENFQNVFTTAKQKVIVAAVWTMGVVSKVWSPSTWGIAATKTWNGSAWVRTS
jgi:hypothetical protein